jgi:hypothetical protein
MKMALAKILARGAGVLVLVALLAAITVYGDVRTGQTFATGGGIDLLIDAKSTYNGVLVPSATWALKNLQPYSDRFFKLDDIKPGDHGESTISLHVKNKDAWACMTFKNLKDKENGRNEPESIVDPTSSSASGELSKGMEFFSWFDDGDNIFEVGEKPIFGTSTQSGSVVLNNKTYAITDAWTPRDPLKVGVTRYIGFTWCAGNLTVNVPTATITCDGSAMGNEAQTDSMSVDIEFHVESSWNHAGWTCLPKFRGDQVCLAPVKVDVKNDGYVENKTESDSDTGGNHAGSGGSVKTGSATSTASTTNIVNRTEKEKEKEKEKDKKKNDRR